MRVTLFRVCNPYVGDCLIYRISESAEGGGYVRREYKDKGDLAESELGSWCKGIGICMCIGDRTICRCFIFYCTTTIGNRQKLMNPNNANKLIKKGKDHNDCPNFIHIFHDFLPHACSTRGILEY